MTESKIESKIESRNREDTTESAVASIHERWPVSPAQMTVAIERVANCRQATLHSVSSLFSGGIAFGMLGAFLELPVKILLELFGVRVDYTTGLWVVAIFLVVALIVAARRFPMMIRHANRPKFDLIEFNRLNDAVTQRPPCRICPVCGGDPFRASGCCKDFPAGWKEDDCQAFWFNLATRKKEAECNQYYVQQYGNVGGSMERPNPGLLDRWPYSWRLALTITIAALMPLNWWVGIRLYGGGGSIFWYQLGCFWFFLGVPYWLFQRLVPDLGRTRTDDPRSETPRPTCSKCRHQPDAFRNGRCPECGADFADDPPSFVLAWSPNRKRHHLIIIALVALAAFPYLVILGGSITERIAGVKNRWSAASNFSVDYEMVSNDRLIDMLGRPIIHTNFSRLNSALRERSEVLATEEWDRLARNVTGSVLRTERGYLNDWAEVILRGEYPQTVPPDAIAALERGLWEPSFRIDAAERDRSSLSWIDEKRGGDHHLVVTALRIDGESIPMPEPRSWLNLKQDALELPVSTDRLRSTTVEIDLILFKYQYINDITSSKEYRTAQAEARRNGTPPPTPLTEQPVEFDAEGDPILIPHVWKRSLARTVTPSEDSD